MNSSLLYTKRLVSFMVFDQEGDGKSAGMSSLDEDASMTQLKQYMDGEEGSQHSADQSAKPAASNAKSTQGNKIALEQREQAQQQIFAANFSRSAAQIPLDRLVKQHTYELIEVLLLMV